MGEITSITRQQKNKNRVSIFVEGEYFGSLDEKTFLESGLKSGDILAQDKWDELQVQGENVLAFNKAIAYISKLMRSEKQVREYLSKKGFEQQAIDYALNKMKEYKYIDDEAYAKMIMSHQINVKKAGPMAASAALKKNGISSGIAQGVLEAYSDEAQLENAKAQYLKLLKKYQREEDDFKKKNKIAQAMARRGFDWETIRSAADACDQED